MNNDDDDDGDGDNDIPVYNKCQSDVFLRDIYATLTFATAATERELRDSCVGRIIPTASYCRAHICCSRCTTDFEFSETEKLQRPYGGLRNRTGSCAFSMLLLLLLLQNLICYIQLTALIKQTV